MAVDTRDKRFSMLGLAMQVLHVWPDPSGSDADTEAERIQYVYLYSGNGVADELVTIDAGSRNHLLRYRRSLGN